LSFLTSPDSNDVFVDESPDCGKRTRILSPFCYLPYHPSSKRLE
jgi:hypothetical protein